MDGDGDNDVVSASSGDDKVAWYENGGNGFFSSERIITTNAEGARHVQVADLDGDGDLDVVAAAEFTDEVSWYANDGSGTFSEKRVITTEAAEVQRVAVADLDGDGELDVLSASFEDDKIAWYANDGTGTFSSQRIITTEADGARAVATADFDRDGDLDVVSASENDDTVAWYRNDGTGRFGPRRTIYAGADRAQNVATGDLNGDGNPDVISAALGGTADLFWYAGNGGGFFGSPQPVATRAFGARGVALADLDNDGDLDALSASQFDHKLAWYENISIRIAPVATETPLAASKAFALSSVYPNPTAEAATLLLDVRARQRVSVVVYDLLGRTVQTVYEGAVQAGHVPPLRAGRGGLGEGRLPDPGNRRGL